jgi:hypothetical protein
MELIKGENMKYFILILFLLCSCAMTQADLDYSWWAMQQEYHSDKPIPKIIYVDKEFIRNDGMQIKGMYIPKTDTIVLYKDFTYDTIIHEMHHAMGNDLGEYAVYLWNR